ncbi:hypothetical protein [Serratia nevei]|uniref:Uncharacterized protein n=1 Tax=Serratia nevei TaxID=2703794 RepID=A0ABT7GJX2_9GAMM|nr:hypothetical protein [Serratia nevei]MDK4799058.1 hypothetical protein [Serratia nevei]MDK5111516.1 hypothetical protein [Serratia nevei]MDK5116804.1 hypothetical protein [Serratia nevei]MDK5173950.1 hypothetical protein [Serratia nevei]MDK5302284.1 hypothetical protein [Serratia nevei]
MSVLGAVLLFEDRQPNDLAVDVGAECHGISQPFSERLHGLFLLVLVNGPEHLWSFLQGGTSENGIYGHSRFCNTDFDDKLACLNLSGV